MHSPNPSEERIPAEGQEILDRLSSFLKDKEELKQFLQHIQKPYSVPDIWRMYLSGDYNAELLLQHSLLHHPLLHS